MGQFGITAGQTAKIMGGEPNGDTVVNIAPLRMVVGAFRQKCNLCHEAERFNEGVEAPFPFQPIISNRPCRTRAAEDLPCRVIEQNSLL